MKSFVLISLCVIGAYADATSTKSTSSPIFPLIARKYAECASELKLNDKATVSDPAKRKIAIRCVRLCQLQKVGAVNENKLVSEEAFAALSTNVTSTKTEDEIKEITTNCIKIVEKYKDACLMAASFLGCGYNRIYKIQKTDDKVDKESENGSND